MEQKVAAFYAQLPKSTEPFGGRAPTGPIDGEIAKWTGRSRIRWGGAVFGGERITAGVNGKGEQVLRSELYAVHSGEWNTMVLAVGEDFHGAQLVLGAEGAEGRGAIMLEREGQMVRSAGTLPSGAKEAGTQPLPSTTFLVGERFLASLLVYRNRLQVLPIGESFDVDQAAAWAGSSVRYTAQKVRFSRIPDVQRIADGKTTTIRRFEIRGPGTLSELHIDGDGYPLRLTTMDHGATATIEKID